MSAYVIGNYNIIDKELYQEYVQKTFPILMKYEGEPIVIDSRNETVEGENRNQVIVLKFKTKEAAYGWINDDEYKEVKKLRQKATENGFLTVCSEFSM